MRLVAARATDVQRTSDFDGGFDFKYSLTPSLTFDATYRTDFAQVEVDQQQVNLTRFNLFFPEKRDFFLENAGTFTFGGVGRRSNNNSQPGAVLQPPHRPQRGRHADPDYRRRARVGAGRRLRRRRPGDEDRGTTDRRRRTTTWSAA